MVQVKSNWTNEFWCRGSSVVICCLCFKWCICLETSLFSGSFTWQLGDNALSLTRSCFLWQFYQVIRAEIQEGCRTGFSRGQRSASGAEWDTAVIRASSWKDTRCWRAVPARKPVPPGIFRSPSAEVKYPLFIWTSHTEAGFNELFGVGKNFTDYDLDLEDLRSKHDVVNIEVPFYWIP